MAKMRCKCGAQLRDDDTTDGLLLFSRRDYDVDVDSATLVGRAAQVWRCPACRRLWIFWDPRDETPAEYLPAEGARG